MTEPQVWTLIGVFSASLIGMIALISQLFVRTMNSQFDALRGEMTARFEKVDARFEAMDAKFEAMDAKFEAKFEAVNTRLDHIDRDVQAISARVFPS